MANMHSLFTFLLVLAFLCTSGQENIPEFPEFSSAKLEELAQIDYETAEQLVNLQTKLEPSSLASLIVNT